MIRILSPFVALAFISLLGLTSCALFRSNPLSETDPAKTRAELQRLKTIGYFISCEGHLSKFSATGPRDDSESPCAFLYSKILGEKAEIQASLARALVGTFSQWSFVDLGPQLAQSAAFSRCYTKLFFLEGTKFQRCIGDQATRQKIQQELKLDAIVYLHVEINAAEKQNWSLIGLVPGVDDLSLIASIDYEFQLANAAVDPILIAEQGSSDHVTLSEHRKHRNLGSSVASPKPTLLFEKTTAFLAPLKTKFTP